MANRKNQATPETENENVSPETQETETDVTETETETETDTDDVEETETTGENRLTALLKNRSTGGRGKVIATVDELAEKFQKAGCETKTDMIMTLHREGVETNDIAVTLREHGVLPKSAYQMVRNTIDRVTSKEARDQKKAS